MHAPQATTLLRMAIALAGLINIYLGYRFFSDVPFAETRSARGRMLANMGSGTLLTLLGMAILFADASTLHRGARVPRSAVPTNPIQHKAPASCGSAMDAGPCNHRDAAWRAA
jgi:hypothetical protein